MKPQCETCPFAFGDAVEDAINLGCVPAVGEIMGYKRDHNLNWGCHSAADDEVRPCAGFVARCRKMELDHTSGDHLSYDQWFREGLPA